MTETILAEGAIEVGHHTTATWLGMTVNTDTIYATALAAAITLALAFFLRAKVTSTGVPGGVQLFWESITIQMRGQIEQAIGMKIAPFVLPLAVTLFVFILAANAVGLIPIFDVLGLLNHWLIHAPEDQKRSFPSRNPGYSSGPPTIASGTIGAPVLSASRTKPKRPSQRRR